MKILFVIGIVLVGAGLLLYLSSSVFSRKSRKKKRETVGLIIGALGLIATSAAWLFPFPTSLSKKDAQPILRTEENVMEVKSNVEELKEEVQELKQDLNIIKRHLGIPYYEDALPSAPPPVFDAFAKGVRLARDYKWKEAISEFKRSMKEAKGSQIVALYNLIGLCYKSMDSLALATESYNSSLTLARQFNDTLGVSNALGNLGVLFGIRGELDTALKYEEDALRFSQKISDRQGEGQSLGNLGIILAKKGDLDSALVLFGKGLRIQQDIADSVGVATQLANIGNAYLNKGTKEDLDSAAKYSQNALSIASAIDYKYVQANSRHSLGLVYLDRHDLGKSQEYIDDALKIRREIGDRQGEAASLAAKAYIFEARNDVDSAFKYLTETLEIDKKGGFRREEAQDLTDIGRIYAKKGDKEKALIYFNEALKIFVQIRAERDIERVDGYIKKIKGN